MINKKLLVALLTPLTAGLLIVVYFISAQTLMLHPSSSDFFKFYESSQRMLNKQSMYWRAPDRLSETSLCNSNNIINFESKKIVDGNINKAKLMQCLHPNLNTPSFSLAISPIAKLKYQHAWVLWSTMSIACALVSLIIIVRNIFPSRQLLLPIAVLFFLYTPTLINYLLGQVSFYLLLALTLSWLALRKNHPTLSGGLLGLIASIKLFFGLFLIIFIFSKKWRSAAAFTIFFCTATLLSLSIVGVKNYQSYLIVINEITWYGSNWNSSILGFFTRILGGGESPTLIASPISSSLAFLIFSILLIALLIHISRKLTAAHSENYADLMFSLTIPAMILLSPLGWIYYFPLLILSILPLWKLSSGLYRQQQYRITLIMIISMSIIQRALRPAIEINTRSDIFLSFSLATYSLLLLLLVSYKIINDNLDGKISSS